MDAVTLWVVIAFGAGLSGGILAEQLWLGPRRLLESAKEQVDEELPDGELYRVVRVRELQQMLGEIRSLETRLRRL